ncbi:MAG: hypothetical protein WAO20_17230 [Acidobacteriota bacterium]
MFRQPFFRLFNRACLQVVLVLATTGVGLGQGYTAPEYDEYLRAVEAGPDALIEWYKTHPDSTLREYVAPKVNEWAQAQAGEGNYKEAVEIGEKFLGGIDGEQVEMLKLTTYWAFNSQQWAKATRYGEKVYQAAPETADLLKILAYSYRQLSDLPKTVEYGEKFCAEASPADCYSFYPVIAGYYVENKEWAQADSYARKVIDALETVERPEGMSEEAWSQYVADRRIDAHSIIGKAAYEREDWKTALAAYGKLLQLSVGDRERRAEAYFFIGMAHWRLEEFTPAMEALARCTLLEGTTMQKHCRSQLEVLYRATHNGSLAGLEEFLEDHPPD